MHHQLHPARVVEEALEHDIRVGGHEAEAVARGAHVGGQLARPRLRQGALPAQAADERVLVVQPLRDLAAQAAHLLRKLDRAPGRFPQPEGHGGRRAVGVHHTHRALLHAADAPRGGAQQEDVPRRALHGEILVHRAHGDVLRLGHDAVVAHLGDDAAVVEGGQPRPPPSAHHAVDAVAVDERGRAAGPLADALRQHGHDLVEGLARERREGRGAAHERVEGVLRPGLAGALGHDLLGQHVERRVRRRDAVQPPRAHRPHERRAFHQLVARGGEEASVRAQPEGVAGAPDALQQRGDAARRPHLADEVDAADVDAQLQRGRRHQRLQVARLQAPLHLQAALFGDAAVVAGHGLLAQPLGQVLGDALGEGARVHEHERRAALAHQLREAVVDVGPLLARGHGLEVARRRLHVQLEVALVPEVHDGGGAPRSGEEARDQLDRALRGGEADARGRALRHVVETREAERQVAAAPVPRERVNLVHDDRAHAAQGLARALRREHEEERFGRGHEDVRRAARHRLAHGRGRVPRAHGDRDGRQGAAPFRRQRAHLRQRLLEVALDVVAERLQGRDVDDARDRLQLARLGIAHEPVDAGEEGGERLAGAGGRGHERRLAREDAGPALGLRVGGALEAALEPVAHDGVEGGQRPAAGGRVVGVVAREHAYAIIPESRRSRERTRWRTMPAWSSTSACTCPIC